RDGRLRVDVHLEPTRRRALARDVRHGLSQPQKALPPKYFYDDRGSRLFDAICDLPEYYLTRTEQALLEQVAEEVVAGAQPANLGSTIGNFTPAAADGFLSRVAAQLDPGDHFLLGVDLVKDRAALHAAYNDSAGVTADFNRNILRVINRGLGGDFDPRGFDHV